MRGLVLPLLALVAWQAAASAFPSHSDMAASPHQVLAEGVAGLLDGSLLVATAETLTTALLGLSVGITLGAALGLLFGAVRWAADLSKVTVELVRPIPAVALIPLAMLVFGFGYGLGISVVAFACLWPTMIITQSAVMQVPRELREVARALELNSGARAFKILLPCIVPNLFTALRLATGIALVVAITVEIAVNPLGLGYALVIAEQTLRPARMFATLLWIGVLGWLLNAGLRVAQQCLFARWAP